MNICCAPLSAGVKIENLHPGLFKCPGEMVLAKMPELWQVIKFAPFNPAEYTFDVKVHMLKKGMYPSIPNWHHDLVPRDLKGQRDYSKVDPRTKIYMWISGDPLPMFTPEEEPIKPEYWKEFSHLTIHKATIAKRDTWRIFIRAAPKDIYPAFEDESKWLRRHSQVYLDASAYTW